METVTTKLPPALTAYLDRAVKEGWYSSRSEALRDAVRFMAQRRTLEEMKQAMLEDIDWALTTDVGK